MSIADPSRIHATRQTFRGSERKRHGRDLSSKTSAPALSFTLIAAHFWREVSGLRRFPLITLFPVVNASDLKSISPTPDSELHHSSQGQRILRRCRIAFVGVSLMTLGDVYLHRSIKDSHEPLSLLYLVPANLACLILWISLISRISRHWRGIRVSKRHHGALLLALIIGITWASFLGADLAAFFAKPVAPSTPSSPISYESE